MKRPRLKGQRVAITGAAGFLGTRLTRVLREQGAQVRAAVRHVDRASVDPAWADDPGLELVEFDLLKPDSFPGVVEEQDIVLHLAAWIGRPGEDARLAAPVNVEAVRGLVSAAQDAGVRRLVLISTVGVYGLPDSDWVTEDTPLRLDQADPYGRTKAMGEEAARAAATSLELVIVRPGMIHGPGARNWTRKMAELVKRGVPTVLGKGDGQLFPVFIDNLLDALLLAATVPEAAGEAFQICDGPLTWRAFMDRYAEIVGRPVRSAPAFLAALVARLPLGIGLTPHHVALTQRKLVFDTTRAETVLGWKPRVDLDEAMAQSAAWLESEGIL